MIEPDEPPQSSPRQLRWWLSAGAAGVFVFGLILLVPRGTAALEDFASAKALNTRVANAFSILAEPGPVKDLVFGEKSPVEFVVFANYSCDLCRLFWRYFTDAERLAVLPSTRLHFLLDPKRVELDSTAVHALLCAASEGNFRVVHRWLVDRDGWTRPGHLSRVPGLTPEGCDPTTTQRVIERDRELAEQLGLKEPPVVLTRTRAFQGLEALEFIRELGSKPTGQAGADGNR